MLALKESPKTQIELGDLLGISERHVRRILKNLPVKKRKEGHFVLYSPADDVVIPSSITTLSREPENVRPKDGQAGQTGQAGHLPSAVETPEKQTGQAGHPKKDNSKNRYRNRRRDSSGAGQPEKSLRIVAGFDDSREQDPRTGIYEDSLVRFERDSIQFVLIDKKFRDLLFERAKVGDWEVRENRGKVLIHIPSCHLRLQVARDTVVFYSAEPGDMSGIAAWAKETFSSMYPNIETLVNRIKNPESLSVEELCVIVTRQPTIEAIRTGIEKDSKNGVYTLPQPNETRPGLKIYERDGTMRIEFICTTLAQAVSALDMRVNLINNLPRMHRIPGLFWEFVQRYYSALHHPIMIDTGGHEFLKTLENVVAQFTGVLKEFAAAKKNGPDLEISGPLEGLVNEIEGLDGFDIEGLVKAFAKTLKLERKAVKVYLAAWSAWAGRGFNGRVLKEDVSSILTRANEPLTLTEIADAIDQLQRSGLMQKEVGYDVKFSPAGARLARKLTAKREMVQ